MEEFHIAIHRSTLRIHEADTKANVCLCAVHMVQVKMFCRERHEVYMKKPFHILRNKLVRVFAAV